MGFGGIQALSSSEETFNEETLEAHASASQDSEALPLSPPLPPPSCTSAWPPFPSRVILIFISLLSPGPLTVGWGGSTGFVSSQAPPLPTPRPQAAILAPSSLWSALSDLAFAWISGPTASLRLSTWSCFSYGGALAKGLSPAPELTHLYASVNLKGNDNQLLLIPFYLTHRKAV